MYISKNTRLLQGIFCLLIFSLLVSCSPSVDSVSKSAQTQTSTPAVSQPSKQEGDTVPGQIQPETDQSSQAQARPAGQSPLAEDRPVVLKPEEIEEGKVTIILNKSSFSVGENITFMIANGLPRPIYSEDLKSDCSIAILEQKINGSWQLLPGCGMERLALATVIEPGHGHSITLNPASTHFGATSNAAQPMIGAGTYRIKFTYRFEPGPEGVEPEVTYSDLFRINEV